MPESSQSGVDHFEVGRFSISIQRHGKTGFVVQYFDQVRWALRLEEYVPVDHLQAAHTIAADHARELLREGRRTRRRPTRLPSH